jgi:3-oxoacyl-[acyl-carrier protein] reductase
MQGLPDISEQLVPTYPDLAGKVAVVTGGSKGIGAACCRMLAANGARVAISARSAEGIAVLLDELRDGGADAIGVAGDCTSPADLGRLREEVEAELGPADILLTYAGGFSSFTPIEDIEEAEWRQVIDANLTSTFLTVKSFLPGMIERRTGAIVTMSSNGGRYLDKLLTASYAAAKAGVIQFTRHIALELGEHNIRANSIAPATVASERVARIMDDEARDRTAAMSPLGRLGTPEDCALATLFLASDASSWLTGVTLDVAGGRIML